MNTDPTVPVPRTKPDAPLAARYRGCLLGGAVGDALGAPVEFLSLDEIVQRFGPDGIGEMESTYGAPGMITDDTQMTLFTAEGLLRAFVRARLRGLVHPPSVIHYAYLRWLHTQGECSAHSRGPVLDGWLIGHRALFARRAPGHTCLDALREERPIGEPAHNHSKGCGGVMRVAPVGMLHHALAAGRADSGDARHHHAFTLASAAAALTHGHPTGQLTAGVMAALVFDLLDGGDLTDALVRVEPLLRSHDRYHETLDALLKAQALANGDLPPRSAIRQLGAGWIAEEALAIGVYCALVASDFEHGVRLAVNHDGDSDSTGLIAGHLLGARLGLDAIPARWLAPLELRQTLLDIADDLATAPMWRLDDGDDEEALAAERHYVQRYPGG